MAAEIPVRLGVSEAGRLFGVSTKTIRDAIKRGEVGYIVVRGRYRLNFESLLAWSQRSTRRRNQLARAGLGRYVEQWHISNRKYSPRPPVAPAAT